MIKIIFLNYICLFALAIPVDKDGSNPLNLTPYLEKGQIEQARQLSAVDPTLFAGVKSHAGYFNVNKTHGWNTFFWYFPVEKSGLEPAPIIIWLQGGPGGSSLYGLFTEIGPLQFVNRTVQKMPVTWAADYSLLFIDNPVGVGFSYYENPTGPRMHDQDDVGRTLLNFYQQFLQVFTDEKDARLYITGESYAGKYIPAFGHYIHNYQNSSVPINLKGLMIGDGFTDPPTLLHYSELLLQIGMLSPEEAAIEAKREKIARDAYAAKDYKTYVKNYDVLGGYNYIDDRELDEYFAVFLNKKEIQKALHVQFMKYETINWDVHDDYKEDMFNTVKPWLEELLEHYGVLCYNGQLDVVVGYALSVHTYRSLKWSGQEGYLKAKRFRIDGLPNSNLKSIGFARGYKNFVEVMIRAAGHMVPMDQPEAAKFLIDFFTDMFR